MMLTHFANNASKPDVRDQVGWICEFVPIISVQVIHGWKLNTDIFILYGQRVA